MVKIINELGTEKEADIKTVIEHSVISEVKNMNTGEIEKVKVNKQFVFMEIHGREIYPYYMEYELFKEKNPGVKL